MDHLHLAAQHFNERKKGFMVLEFLLDMEYFKKRKKKKSHDAIVPSLLTAQHQKITLRQLIVSSGGRENFNSIDLFLTCFQTFLIRRAISVTLERSQQSFCLSIHFYL